MQSLGSSPIMSFFCFFLSKKVVQKFGDALVKDCPSFGFVILGYLDSVNYKSAYYNYCNTGIYCS